MAVDPATAAAVAQTAGSLAGLFSGLFKSKPSRKPSHAGVKVNASGDSVVPFVRAGAGTSGLSAATSLATEINRIFSGKQIPWGGDILFVHESNSAKTGSAPFFLTVVPRTLDRGTALESVVPSKPLALSNENALISTILNTIGAQFPGAVARTMAPKMPPVQAVGKPALVSAKPQSETIRDLIDERPLRAPIPTVGPTVINQDAPAMSLWPAALAAAGYYFLN